MHVHSYDMMLDCWEEKPEDRPTFVALRKKFDGLLAKQKNALYIDLIITEEVHDNDLKVEQLQNEHSNQKFELKPSELKPGNMESSQKRNSNLYVENPLFGSPDGSTHSLRSAGTSPTSTSPMRGLLPLSLPSSSYYAKSHSNMTSF